MWKLTADPILSAPNEPEDVTVEFERGIPVKITSQSTGTKTDPTEIFLAANAVARKHGVGRIDVSLSPPRTIQLMCQLLHPKQPTLGDCELWKHKTDEPPTIRSLRTVSLD